MPRGGRRPGAGTKKGTKRGPYMTAQKREAPEPVDITEYGPRMKAIIERELGSHDQERQLRMFDKLKDYFFQKQPLAVDNKNPSTGPNFLVMLPPKDDIAVVNAEVIDVGQLGPSPSDSSASDAHARADVLSTQQGEDSSDATSPNLDDDSQNPS